MNIIYTGPGSLAYHSAPSAFNYVFFSGVAQEVKKKDEEFFETMAANSNNPWRVEGAVEVVVKNAADTMVDAVDAVVTKLTKKEKKEKKDKGDEE
jgi:hypothetical protein